MFEQKESYDLFISYERLDSGGWSLFLYGQLKDRFGDGAVFRDNQELGAGTKWKDQLAKTVATCKGFILMIGPDWKEQRVLQKLRDPESWVRKEIVTALEYHKPIFPILVGGTVAPALNDLPSEIRPAIHENNHFHFPDGPSWHQELERLCADIEKVTGISSVNFGGAAVTSPYEHLICRLDRNAEVGSVKQRFSSGDRMFVASGSKRSGFRYFAIRCAIDVVTDRSGSIVTTKRKDAARIEALNWGRFSEPDDPKTRRAMLLSDIATSVFTDSAVRDEAHMESWIKNRIQKNLRPTIIYCTVMRGSPDDAARIEEWFAIWRELLAEDSARTIGVILFVECGWWPWSSRGIQQLSQGGHVVRPSLGKVKRNHIDDWLASDVQRLTDDRLKRKLLEARSRLYRFRRMRHFDDVSDTMLEMWNRG